MKYTYSLFFCFAGLLVLLLSSCAKKTLNTHTKETIIDSTSVKSIIDRNAKITDSIFRKIGEVKTIKPECDSITKAYLENFLKSMNTKKKSGGNEYGFYYDEMQKMVVMYANLAETVNEINDTKSSRVQAKSELKETVIPVKYIPTWVQYFAFAGGAFVLFIAYRISRIFI